jgi:23S rRNA pseudouridine2605 synthase
VSLNGRTVELGDRAAPGRDEIAVDGIALEEVPEPAYFALNKPAGVLSTVTDTHGRRTVLDLLGDDARGVPRLFPVGRLDMDSTGLILLTNDGFLAHRLMHPSFGVPREYMVEIRPVPSREHLAMLRKGLVLEDGETGPAKVSLVAKQGDRGQVDMVLHAGRKRQIRRSFDHLGYEVVSLNRVRIGPLGLGNLRQGASRRLSEDEVKKLYRQTGLEVVRSKEER